MDTKTLANNLRNAIASNDKYHVELYGEEACRRLMQQQRALDALKKRQDAARCAILDGRDTEHATDENAREKELQDFKQENDWLAGEWVRLLHALGIEDAWRVLDRDDELVDPPATVALNAITPKPTPAMEENPEREAAIQAENAWLREEWARVLESLGRDDAERILDREDDSADAPATVVLDELWKQRVTTTALCSEVARMEPEPAKEPKPERGTCDNCEWFERDESSNSYEWDGECHRYPEPSSHDDADWCGEWEAL